MEDSSINSQGTFETPAIAKEGENVNSGRGDVEEILEPLTSNLSQKRGKTLKTHLFKKKRVFRNS